MSEHLSGGRSGAVRPGSVTARGYGWRHAGRRAWALQDITFDIKPGERVLLLGRSGSGKSTLLHAMCGLLGGDEDGQSAGRLRVDGLPLTRVRGHVGMVLQDPDSQVILSRVGDDVAFGCENLGVAPSEIGERVHKALREVGLGGIAPDRPTQELSGGQKQRLALAGVLAMQPGLLLLDEPTANLDPAGVVEVRDAVRKVADDIGCTLVIVEHRIDIWLPVVDRVILLESGKITEDGSLTSVLGEHGPDLAADGVWVPGQSVPSRTPQHEPGEWRLRCQDLAAGHGGRPVIEHVSLSLRQGQVTAITGHNGTGKTTVGLTLGGLLEPIAGAVEVSSHLIPDRLAGLQPWRWKSHDLMGRIGMVLQEPEHQFLMSSVREELALGPKLQGIAEADANRLVDELLARLRLDHLAEANPFTLSGGEKRRLSVGGILAAQPRVVLLDEPTYGQDFQTWSEMVDLLAQLRDDGAALGVISHDAELVRALGAQRVQLGESEEHVIAHEGHARHRSHNSIASNESHEYIEEDVWARELFRMNPQRSLLYARGRIRNGVQTLCCRRNMLPAPACWLR
jgi:energy-coupling factor transport system ATP-binding protein